MKYAIKYSWWRTTGRTAVACSHAIFCIRLKDIYPRLLKDVFKVLVTVTFFFEKGTTLIYYVSDYSFKFELTSVFNTTVLIDITNNSHSPMLIHADTYIMQLTIIDHVFLIF